MGLFLCRYVAALEGDVGSRRTRPRGHRAKSLAKQGKGCRRRPLVHRKSGRNPLRLQHFIRTALPLWTKIDDRDCGRNLVPVRAHSTAPAARRTAGPGTRASSCARPGSRSARGPPRGTSWAAARRTTPCTPTAAPRTPRARRPPTPGRRGTPDLCQDFGHGSSRNHAAMGSLPSAGLVRSKNNSMARAGIW